MADIRSDVLAQLIEATDGDILAGYREGALPGSPAALDTDE